MRRVTGLSIATTGLMLLAAARLPAQAPRPPAPPGTPMDAPRPPAQEAPAGFDGLTNGFIDQTQYDLDLMEFEEREQVEDGLGPTYNAQSCAECHQSPVSGGGSQIAELRAGQFDGSSFVDHPGGSVVQDRAIAAALQERVLGRDNVRSLRMSLPVLGDGFVEAIADDTLVRIAAGQPPGQRGTVLRVPVLEANGGTVLRVGRFGWKSQHASLLSFAADAYLNEMGVTSPLQPEENTADGRPVDAFDLVADPEDIATASEPSGANVEAFARFMRATKVPPRDQRLLGDPDVRDGEQTFVRVGCATCHLPEIVTAPPGTVLGEGSFVVPPALGGKRIHPWSDFLLHDVGTGDGIVQNGGPETGNLIRTTPLWGLRVRTRLMHDGGSLTNLDAILRHGGQAQGSADAVRALEPGERRRLLLFLDSL